jgi:hypothetical protein
LAARRHAIKCRITRVPLAHRWVPQSSSSSSRTSEHHRTSFFFRVHHRTSCSSKNSYKYHKLKTSTTTKTVLHKALRFGPKKDAGEDKSSVENKLYTGLPNMPLREWTNENRAIPYFQTFKIMF